MTIGNTDGLRRGEHLSDRMEDAERDETFELFRDYCGTRLDTLQRAYREGGVIDLGRQFQFAIEENDTLARLLADVYDASFDVDPLEGIRGIQMAFQKFKESME